MKKLTAISVLVTEYFEQASDIYELCELSIHLDQLEANSNPTLVKIIENAVISVLKPSYFTENR